MPRQWFQSRQATPWDSAASMTPTQEFISQHYRQHYADKHPKLFSTDESRLINSFIPEDCPFCGATALSRRGFTKNGVQRYLCTRCGRSFTPVTGTIFENHKISISEWTEYLLNVFRYVSTTSGSWNNKNSFTTSRYWLQKLFLILEDYQKNIVLSGRVWLDETYYSMRSENIVRSASGKKLRGLSRNQLCIGVACTKNQILCILEGTGRPSKAKTYKTFKDHITPGSTLVHDRDNAHGTLIAGLHLIDEKHDANAIKLLPDKKNPMNRVNQVHARLKDFLNAHSSFNRDNIQGYLDVFTFTMNPPCGYLEKVDELLNLTFSVRKTLRYRDFYSTK